MICIQEIDALLPQTQCKECGYEGCRPYAEALAQKSAPIDRCPPGGVAVVHALASLFNQDPAPFLSSAAANHRLPSVAVIREQECIGCTKCIQACPVDAIVGSGKLMHSVLPHECTGCGLCVEPCPVDCIDMVELNEVKYNKEVARQRYQERTQRLQREEAQKKQTYQQKRNLAVHPVKKDDMVAKQAYIREALARAQAKKHE